MQYTHVVWDFNGTLLNDLDAAVFTLNALLEKRNMRKPLCKDEYRDSFGFPVIEFYKKLGFDFQKEPFASVAVDWLDRYCAYEKNAHIHEGVTECLMSNRKQGRSQIVLSATEIGLLRTQIHRLGLTNYFDDLLALDNIHAHGKIELAKQWIRKVKPQKAIFIGDTVHDYEVARAVGFDCVLVACGHQSKSVLEKCPVPVYDHVSQLIETNIFKNKP